VGDVERGQPALGVELPHQVDDGGPRRHIDCRRRLVQQQKSRLLHQSAGDKKSLLLAAGQVPGNVVGGLLQPDRGQRCLDPPPVVSGRSTEGTQERVQPHRDRFADRNRELRIDCSTLRHVSDSTPDRGELASSRAQD